MTKKYVISDVINIEYWRDPEIPNPTKWTNNIYEAQKFSTKKEAKTQLKKTISGSVFTIMPIWI